jgi:hypothetical protein
MAIVNNGTRVLIPVRQMPEGVTLPIVHAFDDIQYRRTMEISVLKSLVEESAQVDTIESIITQPLVGVNAQVLSIITEDFTNSQAVQYYTDVVSLTSTNTPDGAEDAWLTDEAPSYVMNVVIYVKSN